MVTRSWITELDAKARSCFLLGYRCVADFDISEASLASLASEILERLQEPERALQANECDTINIGLYQGGADIRVWKVHFR